MASFLLLQGGSKLLLQDGGGLLLQSSSGGGGGFLAAWARGANSLLEIAAMLKNVSGQKIGAQMVSATDGSAFTGAVTVAVTLDAGTQATGAVGSGACAHEGGGYHTYAPSQAETNGDLAAFTFTGSGAVPATVQAYTLPATGILAPATLGRTLVVDPAGLADASAVKVGPSGSGTAQTAKDLGAINVTNLNTLSSHDPGATLGTGTSTLTQAQVTGGAYSIQSSSCVLGDARVANLDATVASRAPSATALSTAQWTASRAGYLDNLNVGGNVASQADVQAVNASASKHLLIQTVGQYERPESGSTTYAVEVRTFNATTGAAVNADSDPTLSAVGQTTGSLSGNLGSATNPATGVYRWTYAVASNATLEPIRFDVSATIASATFTLSCYTQAVDLVSATWTSTDQAHLAAVFNKLPTNSIADETLVIAAIGALNNPTTAQIAAAVRDVSNSSPAAGSFGEAARNADAKAASLLIAVGSPAGASLSADVAAVKADTGSLVTRIGSALFSGITSLAQWLGMLAGKQAGDSTARTEIRATGAGSGGFDPTTDSLEAVRDRGDSAWITATGFSTLTTADIPSATKIADTVLRRHMSSVEGSSDGESLSLGSLYGFVQMAQESNTTDSPGFISVYRTDGTTLLGTKALATDADALPATGVS